MKDNTPKKILFIQSGIPFLLSNDRSDNFE